MTNAYPTPSATTISSFGATVVDRKLLTSAERLQYEGYLRREETNAVVARLAADGVPVKEIVRRTGRSRGLVRQIVRGERTDIFRTRQGSLDPDLPFLDAQWDAGCRNGVEFVAPSPEARLLRLEIADDRAVTVIAPESEVVDADDFQRILTRLTPARTVNQA